MTDDQISDREFSELLLACQEIAETYPDGVVFIGEIAVYLHARNNSSTESFAEFTHDADFYISMADMSDLRDREEVVPNRRLSKHQLIKRGFEFDIYTERHSALVVPYDQVSAHAVRYEKLAVASLEHLFVLKLEAYRDRHASTKGQKDAKDLIRIALVSKSERRKFDWNLCIGYLNEEHLELVRRIGRGPEFMSLSKGNAKMAKEMRLQFADLTSNLLRVTPK